MTDQPEVDRTHADPLDLLDSIQMPQMSGVDLSTISSGAAPRPRARPRTRRRQGINWERYLTVTMAVVAVALAIGWATTATAWRAQIHKAHGEIERVTQEKELVVSTLDNKLAQCEFELAWNKRYSEAHPVARDEITNLAKKFLAPSKIPKDKKFKRGKIKGIPLKLKFGRRAMRKKNIHSSRNR